MTKDQALDILIKHSQFFEIYVQQKYVPRALEGLLNEVLGAYAVINPGYTHCGACNDPYFIIDANRYRVAEMNRRDAELKKGMEGIVKTIDEVRIEELKKYTFPKHD